MTKYYDDDNCIEHITSWWQSSRTSLYRLHRSLILS